jgi:hypothetical protein
MGAWRIFIEMQLTYGTVMAFISPTGQGFVGDLSFHMTNFMLVPLVFLGIL